MWHREMGGLHLPASMDPRCVVSLQCRFQLDETTDRTHTFSTVPESVEAKRRLPYLPRGEHGYAQITERFIVDMWRSKSLFLLSSLAALKTPLRMQTRTSMKAWICSANRATWSF